MDFPREGIKVIDSDSGNGDSNGNDHGKRGGKRSLLDYFASAEQSPAKIQRQSSSSSQYGQSTPRTSVPGLEVITDFVSVEEESDLLYFLDRQDWRTDLSRRVIHYGGTYCLMPPRDASPATRARIEKDIITASPVPSELDVVVIRMVAADLYDQSRRPEFCIVNEYTDNNGISAHVENFRFDSPVCGLTLCNGDWMRFHELTVPDDGSVRSGKAAKAVRTGRKVDVWMPRRSLLVMTGEAREKWQHEIVRSKKGRNGPKWRRVSLTFRTVKMK